MMIDATMLIELALKSFVVAGATLVVLRLAKNRSAAERSLIGHLGLIALVMLPAASLLLPEWNPLPATVEAASRPIDLAALIGNHGVAANPAPVADTARAVAPAAAAWSLPSADVLSVWAYFVPLAVLLATMLVAVVRLGAMHRRANVLVNPSWQAALAMAQRRMGFKHGTALLVSEELRSPVSWGLMRPIILLNEQAIDAVDEAEAIIAHELAHVARLDWAKMLIARIACALFWFNPLVWRLARESHQLREEAADDAVLLSEVDGAEYAMLLVNAARHDNRALLLAAHGVAPGKDSLKRRITRVLDADLARGPANGAWMGMCLVALVAVAAPLAAFDPTATRADEATAGEGAVTLVAGQLARPAVSIRNSVAGGQVVEVAGLSQADRRAAEADRQAADADRSAAEADRSRSRDDAIDALIASKAVGLTPEYIASMRAAGFADASVDDLTGARAVGVTPEFAQQMRRYDSSVDLDTVVGAKATGLSPSYFSQMRQMFPKLSLDDAVGMNAVGVTLNFAQQMRKLFPRVTADQLQGMAAVGVSPQYVQEMRKQGLKVDDPEAAIENGVLFTGSREHGQAMAGHPVPGVAAARSSAAMASSIGVSIANSLQFATAFARPAPAPAPAARPAPPAPPAPAPSPDT